jgi:hypothetical protein
MSYGVILILLYFVPAILAMLRGHQNAGAIGMLNIFLGWTVLGWIAALVWACTQVQRAAAAAPAAIADARPPWDAPKTKVCPMCAETILQAALKCKHCGSDLSA